MAHDKPLTLRHLLGQRLDATRLVVLSACETAMPGLEALDEVVSMPSALLEAGVSGAIGSLWSVEDLATAVLFDRFYQLWRRDGSSPVEALRSAQRRVRDLTVEDRARLFPGLDFSRSGGTGPHPYASPFWWGAFAFTGA